MAPSPIQNVRDINEWATMLCAADRDTARRLMLVLTVPSGWRQEP